MGGGEHEEAGENLAGLLSLLMTCQLRGGNPQVGLADVLLRIQTHPQSQIDELLPQNWKQLFVTPEAPSALLSCGNAVAHDVKYAPN